MKDDDFLQAEDSAIKTAERTRKAEQPSQVPPPPQRQAQGEIRSAPARLGDEEALDARVITEGIEDYKGELVFPTQAASDEQRYRDALKPSRALALWSRVISLALLAGAGLCGVLLLTQLAAFWADIASLPQTWQWVLCGVLAVFVLALLIVILKIFSFLWKYRSLSAFNFSQVQSLSRVEEYREWAQRDMARAQKEVLTMLKGYDVAALKKFKLEVEQINVIYALRQELLDQADGILTPESWLTLYREKFQAELLRVAKGRLRSYALKVGAGTAFSPFAIVDQALVLHGTLCLSRDAFEIFNLKLSALDNIKLLAWAIYATYFAGLSQEMINDAQANLVDGLSDPELMSEWSTFATKFVSVNVVSGLTNALFTWRIGRFVLRKLAI